MYLIKKRLKKILNDSNLEYNIPKISVKKVAYKKDKNFLTPSEYSESKLKKIVGDKKDIKINLEYWNYNYCTYDNLDKETVDFLSRNLDILVEDLKKICYRSSCSEHFDARSLAKHLFNKK